MIMASGIAPRVPPYDDLLNPVLRALRSLGGSGSIEEIYDKVVELEKFPDDMLVVLHDADKSNLTQLEYRLAWARTYLKKYGLLENSSRGIWALAPKANGIDEVDSAEVVRTVRSIGKRLEANGEAEKGVGEEENAEEEWKQKLYRLLTQVLDPSAFERLVQRLLRESGFTQVEVTGRTGDGGIDGKGIARIHGLLSFHVLFQCKRYRGSVGPSEIRDFRGAMVGRTDKGLFITTGTFTPAAIREATRDGAPAIELIDGNALAEKMKELKIGMTTELVEVVSVNSAWFETL